MRRRVLFPVAAVVLFPTVVLGVQVQLARTAPRLDDEVGFRPVDLAVGSEDPSVDVVWLGDSTSTGVGTAQVEDTMAFRVVSTRNPSARLTILGVSGDQVHEVIDDQLPLLRDRVADGDVPDAVYVSIGANDVTALTRRATFEGRYRSMVDEIVDVVPDAEIVLIGIPDMGTAPRIPVPLRQIAGRRAAQLDDVIVAIAEDEGLHHVDLAERTSATFSSDPDRYFSLDGFHPSADGHELWADAVVASIDESSR
ncbi:SGNH/GDSL hydrolase family protein [Actinospongicola halichondriae]|uniref:SGNH/GDSL hydrolase family protein n=1 Tax=Actinospongicola halichondriae TaxID=3236844 RepID=UPI003D53F5C0